jgi:hypothetical protein
MTKRQRLLTAGLPMVGGTGFAMATQWGHAAERPDQSVPATAEMMSLMREEHELVAQMIRAQLAVERDIYEEQRTAVDTRPNVSVSDQR